MRTVTIVDYGVGNIFSVAKAITACGARAQVSKNASEILQAEKLILPGVGAFGRCMQELNKAKLVDVIKEYAAAGGELLGICVGMQMLADSSTEFGEHAGLSLIAGKVEAIKQADDVEVQQKIPRIGWAALHCNTAKHSCLSGLAALTEVYYLHSYHYQPQYDSDYLAYSCYNGKKICAAVKRSNITGLQFHPEKSGVNGLRILKNFIDFTHE